MPEKQIDQTEEENAVGAMEKRLQSLLGKRKETREKPRLIHAILNPAAGRDQPILKTLNAAFRVAEVDWEMRITKQAGDARRFAQQAVQAGADVVAVYGGDGSVMEAASGLVHSPVPLAIIPGGTANVMAQELGIPNGLIEACALVVNPAAINRIIDVGQAGDHYFLLRASVGFEAAMVAGADRNLKDRLGRFAYTFSALQELVDPQISRYRLTLDGEVVETEGLVAIVSNSGNIGLQGISLAPNISVSDGLLDLLVVRRADLPALVALMASIAGGEGMQSLQHWQVREATIEADPMQKLQVDGEMLGETPVTVRVVPEALRVVVPPVEE